VDLHYIYKIFIECSADKYDISTGMETLDVGFFAQGDLPELSTPRTTVGQIDMMYEYRHGKASWPRVD
jgi:hypothetical protein